MQVTDPSGRCWQIKRRLIQLPHWRHPRNPIAGAGDGADAAMIGDDLGAILVGLLVVVALALTFAFVWPLVLLIAELIGAALLVVWRLALGRWTVVAETDGERRSWRVRGHGAARRFAASLAELLRSGGALPFER
jgi:hypothetical protein